MAKFNRPKIGLALGSGGARGLAHIGVIKALEENNIPIDFIAGSSVGALIGGAYASGLSIKEIEEIALSTDWRKMSLILFEPSFKKKGLIGGDKVKAFIKSYIKEKNFYDCKIPFKAVATNLKTGEVEALDKGDMAQAIRASISIPLVFKPVEIDGKTLVDGAISAPVPVKIVKEMGADIVIAVNLDKHFHNEKWVLGWYKIANNSMNILKHHLASLNAENADINIEINSGKTRWFQFINGGDKILAGEKEMNKLMPKLLELINKKSKSRLGRIFERILGS